MDNRGVQNAQMQGPTGPDSREEQFPWISAAEGLDGLNGYSRY
jgi:hypothetical protein